MLTPGKKNFGMDVSSVNPVAASLYTASSLARAAAEAGPQPSSPVATAPPPEPAEDRGAAILLERSQYQASLNARLGMALQQTQALEAVQAEVRLENELKPAPGETCEAC